MTIRARFEQSLRRILPSGTLAYRIARKANRVLQFDQRIGALEQRLQALEQHLPAFLNAVSSVGAFGFELHQQRETLQREILNVQEPIERHASDIVNLWARIEFIRKEILYEMKYGQIGSSGEFHPRVASPERVTAALEGKLRINLGCGHVPLNDYINIDRRDLPGVDIIAEVGNLPFESGSVHEIFLAHVLEHFPQEQLRRLLPYWRSLLMPRGVFHAIVPDGQAMLDGIAAGTYSFADFRLVLFGAQEYNGDYHFNLLTPGSLTDLLKEAGFNSITVPIKGRKNDVCYEFEIYAQPG